MNLHYPSIQPDNNLRTVSALARLLMSTQRQRIQRRAQLMLNRAAGELGIDA